MSATTVTVIRTSKRAIDALAGHYALRFSHLPGRTFGMFTFTDITRDLLVSALLTPAQARDLVLTAHAEGSATAPVAL